MSNPLFNQFGNGRQNMYSRLMGEVDNFRKSFRGDPRQEVQNLLNSGHMSQAQFNQYSQFVMQMADAMGKK